MDDTKQYFTVQVKGEAYRFHPMDLEAVQRLGIVQAMSPSAPVLMKAIFAPMKAAAVDEASWDALTTRLVEGTVTLDDMTALLDKLVKRTVDKAKAPSGDAE